MNTINLNNYPTTRYQGSKRKILPWIYSTVKNLEFNTVLDAFGGSASVSYLFKKMNKSVTFNDQLTFNHIIGKAIIENQNIKLTNEDIANLLNVNEGVNYKNFIQNNFKDIYYLPEENAWLDRVVSNITQMNHYQGAELEYKKSIAFYALFQSCIIKRPFNLFHRKNLNLRTADVKRNFGNKTTWDKSFDEYLHKFSDEVNSIVFDSKNPCNSINQSVFEINPEGYDLVYFDPPYLKDGSSNESSNYMKSYHFLEGLSNYERWEDLIDFNTINLRFKKDATPNEFIPEKIHETYEELISKYRNSIIVISYKKGGLPSIDFFINLVQKIKGNAHSVSKHYKYALNHQNGNAKNNREVLIIGK